MLMTNGFDILTHAADPNALGIGIKTIVLYCLIEETNRRVSELCTQQ